MQAKAMRNYNHHRRRQPSRTATAHTPPRDRTQARRPHAQLRESDHANAGRAPATGPWPAGYAPLLPTPRPPSPTTSSPAKASAAEKSRTRPQPPTSQKRRQGNNLPTPRTPSDPPDRPGVRPAGPPPPTRTCDRLSPGMCWCWCSGVGGSRARDSTPFRGMACFLDLLGRMYMPGSPDTAPRYMLPVMVGAGSGWRKGEVHVTEQGGWWCSHRG